MSEENRAPPNSWWSMEHQDSGAEAVAPRRKRAQREEERDNDEDVGNNNHGSNERCTSPPRQQRHRGGENAWEREEEEGNHVLEKCRRKLAVAQLGCVNDVDPLTGVALDPQRPIVLLVNEDSRQLMGFDLYSLYHIYLKKGKTRIQTFDGHYTISESVEMIRDYERYFGCL